MIAIRNEHKALQIGDFNALVTDDEREIFAFKRQYQDQSIIVVLNNSERQQEIEIPACHGPNIRDLLNDTEYSSSNNTLVISVAKKWGAVLLCAT